MEPESFRQRPSRILWKGGERNPLLLLFPHTHAAPTKAKYYACRTEMTALVSMMALEFAILAFWRPQHRRT